MTCNVGGIEKPLRIVGGLLLIGVGALGGLSTVGTGIALTLGAVFLVTGVIGYCPLAIVSSVGVTQPEPPSTSTARTFSLDSVKVRITT